MAGEMPCPDLTGTSKSATISVVATFEIAPSGIELDCVDEWSRRRWGVLVSSWIGELPLGAREVLSRDPPKLGMLGQPGEITAITAPIRRGFNLGSFRRWVHSRSRRQAYRVARAKRRAGGR